MKIFKTIINVTDWLFAIQLDDKRCKTLYAICNLPNLQKIMSMSLLRYEILYECHRNLTDCWCWLQI